MRKIKIETNVVEYDSVQELPIDEQALLKTAHEVAENAYAPYSKFYVGAALLLENNKIVVGNNQENAAYPSGICAERVAIFSASANYPDTAVQKIAIVAHNKNALLNYPVTPCGSCRQALSEYEHKFQKNIKLIMMGETGKVYVLESVKATLPLSFSSDQLF
jgi:cytidine deaminase